MTFGGEAEKGSLSVEDHTPCMPKVPGSILSMWIREKFLLKTHESQLPVTVLDYTQGSGSI